MSWKILIDNSMCIDNSSHVHVYVQYNVFICYVILATPCLCVCVCDYLLRLH